MYATTTERHVKGVQNREQKPKSERKNGLKPEGFLKYGLIIKYFKASSAFLTNI